MAQSAAHEIVITERQADQTIPAHAGEVVTIKLAAQPGTGYSWQCTSDHPQVAAQEGEPELLPEGDAHPGGLKMQVFHLRILGRGTAHIVMKYARPWEKDASPQKTFRVTIHAHAKANAGGQS
jgi:inhibitor of cysteine peptidase